MERILGIEQEKSIDNLINRINSIVGNKFTILGDNSDIERWNLLPKLLLLNDKEAEKILSFVEYLDSSYISLERRIDIILSACGLLDIYHAIINYDIENLLLLADYYSNESMSDVKQTLPIIKNENILLEVRKRTLDLEKRKSILSAIFDKVLNSKLDINKEKNVNDFIDSLIKEN